MADAIGTEDFVYVHGPIDPAGQTFEEVTRAAVDGVAYRKLGKRGRPTQLLAGRDYLDGIHADLSLDFYKTMLGEVVTVTQYGAARAYYLILEVSEEPDRHDVLIPVGGILGGLGFHWMNTMWVVRYVGVIP